MNCGPIFGALLEEGEDACYIEGADGGRFAEAVHDYFSGVAGRVEGGGEVDSNVVFGVVATDEEERDEACALDVLAVTPELGDRGCGRGIAFDGTHVKSFMAGGCEHIVELGIGGGGGEKITVAHVDDGFIPGTWSVGENGGELQAILGSVAEGVAAAQKTEELRHTLAGLTHLGHLGAVDEGGALDIDRVVAVGTEADEGI